MDRSKDLRNASSLKMKELESQPVSASAATVYRGITARISYPEQDSAGPFAVKELAKEMSDPSQGSWLKFKRLL